MFRFDNPLTARLWAAHTVIAFTEMLCEVRDNQCGPKAAEAIADKMYAYLKGFDPTHIRAAVAETRAMLDAMDDFGEALGGVACEPCVPYVKDDMQPDAGFAIGFALPHGRN